MYAIPRYSYSLVLHSSVSVVWNDNGCGLDQRMNEEEEKAAFDRYVQKYGLERKICDRVGTTTPRRGLGGPRKVTGEFNEGARYHPSSNE